MIKKNLIHGLLGGVLAGIIAVVYQSVYSSNLGVDFSAVANPIMILITIVIGTLIASLGYWLLNRLNWFGSKTDMVFNLLFFLLSFVSIYGTFGAPLPAEMLKPELFPGLTIPMHFFPMLGWFMVLPLLEKKS